MSTLDDFIIRRSTLEDVPAISKLLEEVALPGDPEFRLMVGSGIVPQQEMIDFVVATHTHSSVILHPCSLVATIRSFDNGCHGGYNKVVAFRMSCAAHHPGHVDEDSTIQSMIEKSSGLQRRARMFKDIESGGMDVVMDTTPSSSGSQEGSIDFLQLTVDPNYRRQGLAKKLVQEAIVIAKSLPESRCINVCAASRYTSRIFQDQGFQKVSQISYRTYQQDDDDGKPFFNADLVDEHESMELYRLNIEKENTLKPR
mmetsp:Transcript_47194/g.55124  ORF Transcript_47194/g.55124 Transcript_47194/m.55124 type:complete len:256 (-) Transcript_47194:137-904(-)